MNLESKEQIKRPNPPTLKRRDIQGLRAVAVLMVVAFHAGLPLPGGFVGVDVFFVISGFVITRMLDRERREFGKIRFGAFIIRRFKRLTPALALMVAVTVLVSILIVSPLGPQQTVAKTALGSIFLVANFVIARYTGGYFGPDAHINPLLHTWSLSVEEQFYLVFPVLIALAWYGARRLNSTWIPVVLLSGVAAVSFALAVAGSAGVTVPGLRGFLGSALLGFYSPATRSWEFAAGALLALTVGTTTKLPRVVLAGFGAIGSGLLIISAIVINKTSPFPGILTLLPVAGTLFLLISGPSTLLLTSRILTSPPMVKIGDWSYSIYLWHWPLIVFSGLLWPAQAYALPAAALVSIVPAVLSYKYIECPIRSLTGIGSRKLSQLIAAVTVPPICLGSALWCAAQEGWGSESVRRLQMGTSQESAAAKAFCDRPSHARAAPTGSCVWNQKASGAPIYLLGDSNAAQFSDGIISAAAELKRPLIIRTANGCPFVDMVILDPDKESKWNESCRSYVTDTLNYLKHADKGLFTDGGVVLIGASLPG